MSGSIIIDHDSAYWEDLSGSDNSPAALTPPTGLTFADVAGGRAIDGGSGSTYIVGATRATNATAAVLVVDSTGLLSARTLALARAGAAAEFVTGHGVVVVGGASGTPGVEVIPDDGTAEVTPPYAADTTTGASIIPAASDQAILAGGIVNGMPAPTRSIDLKCLGQNDCVFQEPGHPHGRQHRVTRPRVLPS